MVVESPEVLDGVEGDDGPLVVLPAAGAVVLEEPEGPSVLGKNVIDRKELNIGRASFQRQTRKETTR